MCNIGQYIFYLVIGYLQKLKMVLWKGYVLKQHFSHSWKENKRIWIMDSIWLE